MEITSIKKDIHTLHSDHKVLHETLRNKDGIFDVDNSSYKVYEKFTHT